MQIRAPYRRDYDFHGLVSLRVDSFKKAYDKYLYREFKTCLSYSDTPSVMLDVKVHVGLNSSHIPRNISLRYYDRHFRRIFRTRYAITPIGKEQTNIFFWGDWTENIYIPIMGTFLQTSIIEPILYYKSLERGAIMVHSACVSNGKEGFIIVGSGGAGKTTTALTLISKGLQFLGDDLIFVGRDGFVMPYPRPLHLFSYVINGLPFLKISKKLRVTLLLKDIVRQVLEKILKQRFFIATRVPISNVYPKANIGKPVPIRGIYLLSNGDKKRYLQISNKDKKFITETIIETGDVNKILKNLLLESQPQERQWVLQEERKLVGSILDVVQFVCEVNPKKFKSSDWERMIEEMQQ